MVIMILAITIQIIKYNDDRNIDDGISNNNDNNYDNSIFLITITLKQITLK